MVNAQRTSIVILSMALFSAGCTGPGRSNPMQPSPAPAPSPSIPVTIDTITPDVGSTSGGTLLTITGTGLDAGLAVTMDGLTVPARFDNRGGRLYVDAPPHAPGSVDVVLRNSRGETARLAAGYRYASPGTFDFNGDWSGYPLDGSDLELKFTIRNGRLTSLSCGPTAVEITDPVAVTDGAFSFTQSGAVRPTITGWIAAASQAMGTIDLLPCHAPLWQAERVR